MFLPQWSATLHSGVLCVRAPDPLKTSLHAQCNTYRKSNIYCVDVSTYMEIEWVQQKRTKCTSIFPKTMKEKSEDVSTVHLSLKDVLKQ